MRSFLPTSEAHLSNTTVETVSTTNLVVPSRIRINTFKTYPCRPG